MPKIEISSAQKTGIDGLHRLSVCDIRHPQAARIERDIAGFAAEQDRLIAEARKSVAGAVIAGENTAARHWRQELLKLKQLKHCGMAQLYEMLRSLTLSFDTQVHNIIPTAGRAVIARWIIGDNAFDADDGANFGSLGTGSAAPANGDTALANESFRKARSSEAQSSNVATLSNFYTATEVTGTFEEAGWHIDGSASADSGQLLSRFLTGTIVKTSTETLIVESTLTIS